MHFKIKENKLILFKEDKEIGYLKYEEDKQKDYIIQSIAICPIYRGKGYAKKIFDEFIQKAKEENKKITPKCSYTQKQFEKNTNLKNMLKTY